jgi:TPP-dependent pyruvate/acetoin dehydrogenase alpha subunit
VFWETLNWCVLNKLPITFLCENNGMSVDAKFDERQATPLLPRIKAFGLMVAPNVESAVRFARGNEPSFYEHKCRLACDHLNMSVLLPKVDYA